MFAAFEVLSYFIFSRRRVAITRYGMICLAPYCVSHTEFVAISVTANVPLKSTCTYKLMVIKVYTLSK